MSVCACLQARRLTSDQREAVPRASQRSGQCADYFSNPLISHLSRLFSDSSFAMPLPDTHSLDSAAPSHGYPVDKTDASAKADDKSSTASHPPRSKPDPTTAPVAKFHPEHSSSDQDATQGRLASAAAAGSSELSSECFHAICLIHRADNHVKVLK